MKREIPVFQYDDAWQILARGGWAKRDETLLEDCERERAILDHIFDSLFETGQPLTHWYYGHFHQSWTSTIYGILFSMLDIMAFKEVLRE